MKSSAARTTAFPGIASRANAVLPHASALNLLALIAFVLLAAALCGRSLLWELWSIYIGDLLAPPHLQRSGTLMARHAAHLAAAAGIALSALWMIAARKPWRFTGLQAGGLILVLAAMLAVPAASAKRLALNTALDVILPLLAAASLYQLLVYHPGYRRALLAGLIAVAAASCWPDTARRLGLYTQAQTQTQPNVQAPAAPAPQPKGFFHHSNAFASFLELGLASTVAALAGIGWRRSTTPPGRDRALPRNNPRQDHATRSQTPSHTASSTPAIHRLLPLLAIVILATLAIWQLLMIRWIGSLATWIGLASAVPTIIACIWLRSRPRTLAIVLGGGLALLQVTLIVLALRAPTLFPAMIAEGGKVRSFAHRLDYWQGALKLFAASPLTGIGPRQFGSHYTTVKAAIVEDTIDPHNWLLTMAAEWGIIGALGVLVALAGAGWTILRSLWPPADLDDPPLSAALLPTGLLLVGCWLLVIFDMPTRLWLSCLTGPVIVSVVAAVAVLPVRLNGRFCLAIFLGGVVSFLIHTTAETTATVPGAMWPFWAAIALAMAWNTRPSSPLGRSVIVRRLRSACMPLQLAAVLAVVALTIQPMRAAQAMYRAQAASLAGRNDQVLSLLHIAATIDRCDTTALEVAALVEQQMANRPSGDGLPHLRRAVEALNAAVERDPHRSFLWYKLAIAEMTLGCAADDIGVVDRAISHMQRSLQLWPTWSQGWFELAQMAAAITSDGSERPAMLRLALEALDKAQALDDSFAPDDLARLLPTVRRTLEQLRLHIQRRLQNVLGGSKAP